MQALETHLLHVTGTIENPPASLLAGENPTSEGLTGRITEQDLLKGDPRAVQLITGADISYPRFSACAVTGIVVLARPDMEVVETRTTSGRMTFPYVPGYPVIPRSPLADLRLPAVEEPTFSFRCSTARIWHIPEISAWRVIWDC